MDDTRLVPRLWKLRNATWHIFESSDVKRTYQGDVENDMGVQWFVQEMRQNNKLVDYLDKIKGKFCWCEAITLNASRFLLQWVDAFSSQMGDPTRYGRAMSVNFVPIFAGGVIQAGTLLTATHYAGNRAYGDKGINLGKFWVASMVNMLLASPLTALAEKMLNPRLNYSEAFLRAVTPTRLAFNAAFAFSVGVHNNSNEFIRKLYLPSILASGILLRLAGTSSFVTGGLNNPTALLLEARSRMNLGALNLGPNGTIAVAAFALLNLLLPINLTQARGSKQLERDYLEYLRAIESSKI